MLITPANLIKMSMSLPFIRKFDVHMREIFFGASIAFTARFVGAGLAFIFNVILARILGPDDTGIYFLSLTVIMIASVLSRLGLDNTVLRFTAANAANENWQAVKGTYQNSNKLVIACSSVITLIIFVFAPWLAREVFPKLEVGLPMRWMALSVIPLSMLILHSRLLLGLKYIFPSQIISRVAVPAVSIVGLLLFGRAFGVIGAVWAYNIATVITMLAAFYFWHKFTPQLRKIAGSFKYRDLLNSSMPLLVVALMNHLIDGTGTLMLGVWATKADVGMFALASRTAALTSYILVAVNSIAAPKFAEIYSKKDMKLLGEIAASSTRMIALLASPILVLFLFIPGLVMSFFGPQFVNAGMILSIIAVGQFVNAATGPVEYLLMMTGHEKVFRNNVLIGTCLNLILCAVFIPKYGITGAAVATSSALICKNIRAAYLVYKYLNIKVWSLNVKKT